MTEKLKPCPFCLGEATVVNFKPHQPEGYWQAMCRKCGIKTRYHQSKYDAVKAWNTRAVDENPPSLTLILPARVGDYMVVKDGDSKETLRIDGFELRGDELIVWGEGENERYVEFSQHEIIRYIPREEDCND